MSRDGSKKMVFVPDFWQGESGVWNGYNAIKERWVGADWYELFETAAGQPKQDSSSSSSGCTVDEALNAKSEEAKWQYACANAHVQVNDCFLPSWP
jgi:hypothetical protein